MFRGLTGWLVAGACLIGHVSAQEEPEAAKSYLFGDLGRTELAEQGFTLDVLAIHDFWANTSGGVRRDAGIIGNMNISLAVDTAKAGWWEGGQFLAYGIGIYGERPTPRVGDFQFVSSIDSYDTFEPYQFWYSHSFADDSINVLAGIHDLTTEFAVLNYGFQAINSSFWTPPTITQVPASYWPYTALGARIRVKPSEETYVLAGVYDGEPTRTSRLRAVDIGVGGEGGAFVISEIGYESNPEGGPYGKIAVGAHWSNADLVDPMGLERDSNYGAYVIGERQLVQECEDPAQGLGAFFQLSHAAPNRNFVSWYYGFGINYRGLIPGRDSDALTFGFNYASVDNDVQTALGGESNEHVFELAYRAEITPHLFVTPDLQFVQNPGMSREIQDAVVFILRTEIAL